MLFPPCSSLFPYTTLFRSSFPGFIWIFLMSAIGKEASVELLGIPNNYLNENVRRSEEHSLNSSHLVISYAVFCLKKKKIISNIYRQYTWFYRFTNRYTRDA